MSLNVAMTHLVLYTQFRICVFSLTLYEVEHGCATNTKLSARITGSRILWVAPRLCL